MTVTVVSKGVEKIEVTCMADEGDLLRIDDFHDDFCWVRIVEGGRSLLLQMSREDARDMIEALEPWASGEVA